MMFLRDPGKVRARIRLRVQVQPSGCWLWQGTINSAGYGTMKIDREVVTVHSAARMAFKGTSRLSGQYNRTCDGPRHCVNPDHWVEREHYERHVNDAEQREAARARALSYWSDKPIEVRRARTQRKRDQLKEYRRRAVPHSWDEWEASRFPTPPELLPR